MPPCRKANGSAVRSSASTRALARPASGASVSRIDAGSDAAPLAWSRRLIPSLPRRTASWARRSYTTSTEPCPSGDAGDHTTGPDPKLPSSRSCASFARESSERGAGANVAANPPSRVAAPPRSLARGSGHDDTRTGASTAPSTRATSSAVATRRRKARLAESTRVLVTSRIALLDTGVSRGSIQAETLRDRDP